jgi:methylated-DNA-[protein]-cysteine S-methyltransferase
MDQSVKNTIRLIQEARKRWDAHENNACRRLRTRALESYRELDIEQKDQIPQTLRIWLRYRSEKYFGDQSHRRSVSKGEHPPKKIHAPQHAKSSRILASPVGSLVALSTKKAICGLYFKHCIEPTTLPSPNPRDKMLNLLERELSEYFLSGRETFTTPLEYRGTAFQKQVWRHLMAIAYGTTQTYGELARRMENPGAFRAVGAASGVNPIAILIPCHRLIGAKGSLTGFSGGVDLKKKLLEHERVMLRLNEDKPC